MGAMSNAFGRIYYGSFQMSSVIAMIYRNEICLASDTKAVDHDTGVELEPAVKQTVINDEYAVVHRIASLHGRKGAASFCMNYCFNIHNNIRIDTHKNNIPMQKFLEKEGFIKCGRIILHRNNEDRIAFQKVK